ncbi:mechanosensitive ion channel, partial [Pseudomonas lundensis]|nr:mechanosensitive ion channel [Pseudomonas lundensis]
QLSDEAIKILSEGDKKLLGAILVFIAMSIAIRLGNKIIDKFFHRKSLGKISIEERRANTLSTILKSVFRYLIYFVGIVTIVGFFMDVTSIIAVAGVGGLAIGFGAQDLVRDVVTGFFIFLEDQFSVGDYINIDSFGGIVENMGLRTTQIRDFNGDLHILPNGEISRVTNHSRGNMRAMVDVRIAYEEDIQRAIEILNKLCQKIAKENDTI